MTDQDVVFDMDNPPNILHRWVDRGEFLSCEGAGHPNHRHVKRLSSRGHTKPVPSLG